MDDFKKQKEALEKQSGSVELKRPEPVVEKMFKSFSKE
jgi:hypothetical protein